MLFKLAISIPTATPPPPDDLFASITMPRITSHSTSQPACGLVIQDEPDLRTLYELTLLREGFQVEAAGELKSALHRALALGEGGDLPLDTPAQPTTQPQPFGETQAPVATKMRLKTCSDKLQDHLTAPEREIFCRLPQDTHCNRAAAAGKLGMRLRQIRYRVARLNRATPDGAGRDARMDSIDDAA